MPFEGDVERCIRKPMENIRFTFSQSQEVPNQFVYNLPEKLGCGIVRTDHFSSGLCLVHVDLNPNKPITKVGELPAGYYGISFSLEGHSRVHSSDHWQSYLTKPGQSAHYICSDPFFVKEDIGASRKVKILIMFDNRTLLDLAGEDEEPFLPFLKGDKNQIFATGQDKITTEMRRSLTQIAACPYSGKTRTLYLEGKTMEVFAQRLDQMRVKRKSCSRQPRISKTDIERIHYAAELLVHDPVNPPKLNDIAVKIGMSKTKFYQIFKMIFGHAPMDHLRSHRLRIAKQLLRHEGHNVTEAAFAVGYNSLSNFSKIFVAEFGIHPHEVS